MNDQQLKVLRDEQNKANLTAAGAPSNKAAAGNKKGRSGSSVSNGNSLELLGGPAPAKSDQSAEGNHSQASEGSSSPIQLPRIKKTNSSSGKIK